MCYNFIHFTFPHRSKGSPGRSPSHRESSPDVIRTRSHGIGFRPTSRSRGGSLDSRDTSRDQVKDSSVSHYESRDESHDDRKTQDFTELKKHSGTDQNSKPNEAKTVSTKSQELPIKSPDHDNSKESSSISEQPAAQSVKSSDVDPTSTVSGNETRAQGNEQCSQNGKSLEPKSLSQGKEQSAHVDKTCPINGEDTCTQGNEQCGQNGKPVEPKPRSRDNKPYDRKEKPPEPMQFVFTGDTISFESILKSQGAVDNNLDNKTQENTEHNVPNKECSEMRVGSSNIEKLKRISNTEGNKGEPSNNQETQREPVAPIKTCEKKSETSDHSKKLKTVKSSGNKLERRRSSYEVDTCESSDEFSECEEIQGTIDGLIETLEKSEDPKDKNSQEECEKDRDTLSEHSDTSAEGETETENIESDDKIPQRDDKIPQNDDRIPKSDDKILKSDDKIPKSDDKIPKRDYIISQNYNEIQQNKQDQNAAPNINDNDDQLAKSRQDQNNNECKRTPRKEQFTLDKVSETKIRIRRLSSETQGVSATGSENKKANKHQKTGKGNKKKISVKESWNHNVPRVLLTDIGQEIMAANTSITLPLDNVSGVVVKESPGCLTVKADTVTDLTLSSLEVESDSNLNDSFDTSFDVSFDEGIQTKAGPKSKKAMKEESASSFAIQKENLLNLEALNDCQPNTSLRPQSPVSPPDTLMDFQPKSSIGVEGKIAPLAIVPLHQITSQERTSMKDMFPQDDCPSPEYDIEPMALLSRRTTKVAPSEHNSEENVEGKSPMKDSSEKPIGFAGEKESAPNNLENPSSNERTKIIPLGTVPQKETVPEHVEQGMIMPLAIVPQMQTTQKSVSSEPQKSGSKTIEMEGSKDKSCEKSQVAGELNNDEVDLVLDIGLEKVTCHVDCVMNESCTKLHIGKITYDSTPTKSDQKAQILGKIIPKTEKNGNFLSSGPDTLSVRESDTSVDSINYGFNLDSSMEMEDCLGDGNDISGQYGEGEVIPKEYTSSSPAFEEPIDANLPTIEQGGSEKSRKGFRKQRNPRYYMEFSLLDTDWFAGLAGSR